MTTTIPILPNMNSPLLPDAKESRLLLTAKMVPVSGTRFQPTGFPDLGAATYRLNDDKNTEMLLVESAQSMANRLEAVCWDEVKDNWQTPLAGLPCVKVVGTDGVSVTNSVLEAHRLNSPYMLESDDTSFRDTLKRELDTGKGGVANLHKLAVTLLKYDPNSLIHGLFLAKKDIAGGRMRLPRALTAFVEAKDVTRVASGGVKNDRVNPGSEAGRGATEGFGNVPFHRDEFTGKIIAYFNLDLAQIRGYGFAPAATDLRCSLFRVPCCHPAATDLLIAISIYKIQRILSLPFRPRTACDLDVAENGVEVVRPKPLQGGWSGPGYVLPTLAELEAALPGMITECAKLGVFAEPRITTVTYKESAKKKDKADKNADAEKGEQTSEEN